MRYQILIIVLALTVALNAGESKVRARQIRAESKIDDAETVAKAATAAIKDSKFEVTTSSNYNHYQCNTPSGWLLGAGSKLSWCAATNDDKQWIMIDAGAGPVNFKAIATAGRIETNQYVKTNKIKYSIDGKSWLN